MFDRAVHHLTGGANQMQRVIQFVVVLALTMPSQPLLPKTTKLHAANILRDLAVAMIIICLIIFSEGPIHHAFWPAPTSVSTCLV